jgi:2-amino-4-hydroxy-6-hydroxymethyldihydropteridine diphosphokinase
MRVFVSLGSNLDPERNLTRAVAELKHRFRVVAVSRVYRTTPVGDPDQPDFWNLAVELESDLTPDAVHGQLGEIENMLGRRRDPDRPYGPRTADLDIVLVSGLVGRFGGLDLPSPLIEREAFVAVPLAEIAPDLAHPVLHKPLRELARAAAQRSPRPPEAIEVELPP